MHINKPFTLLVLLFYFFIGELYASTPTVDDLLKELESAQGENKLELMIQLINTQLESEQMMNTVIEMEKEARRQNNMRYLAASYAVKARFFSSQGNLDSTEYYAKLSNKTYAKYEIRDPGETHMYLASLYLRLGHYDLAVQHLNVYLENNALDPVAYNMLGHAYSLSQKYSLAKEYYFKAVEFYKQSNNKHPHTELVLYQGLITGYINDKDYELALKICQVMEERLEENLEELSSAPINFFRFQIYCSYANIYIGLEDLKKAKYYLDELIQMPKDGIHNSYIYVMYKIASEYYMLLGNNEEALEYLEKAFFSSQEKIMEGFVFIEMLKNKIKLLENLDRYKDAFSVQKKLVLAIDSINKKDISLQISQISKTYELEKLEMERQKDRAQLGKSLAVNIGLVAIAILLIIILYLFRSRTQELKKKNKILVKRYTELDNYLNYVKKYVIEKQDAELNEEQSLFHRLEMYMQDEKAYKNPNLSREDLARVLNTNWKYLIDAIKAETGKTFLDYINYYRLQSARHDLMSDMSLTVGDVIHQSGFSSTATFYRLFKEEFGVSPKELRQIKQGLMDDLANAKSKDLVADL